MAEETRSFSVQKYLAAFRKKVISTIPRVWVHGVITQIQPREKIVYLTIADFVEGDVRPIATLPLFIFAYEYKRLEEKLFSIEKPFVLKPELKVNFLIEADFYIPAGKFQAKIVDIDPSYTIGELALTREAILKRLAYENLIHKNASLEMAEIPLYIGLITGENTAAYHDFTTKLEESPFAFRIKLVPAKMQGNETENTILLALGKLQFEKNLDVVCIVRGGGAKTDLNYFDSEALCRAVANFPVPVLTGIGHEIDKSLLDVVAYKHCITPTDCAKFLVERVQNAWQKTYDLALEIAGHIRSKIPLEQERQNRIRESLERSVSKIFIQEQENIAAKIKMLLKMPDRILLLEGEKLKRNRDGLKIGCKKILEFSNQELHLEETKIRAVDPKTILARGYSLTLNADGEILKTAKAVTPGTRLTTRFSDGEIKSIAE